jgi:hypothetical protein
MLLPQPVTTAAKEALSGHWALGKGSNNISRTSPGKHPESCSCTKLGSDSWCEDGCLGRSLHHRYLQRLKSVTIVEHVVTVRFRCVANETEVEYSHPQPFRRTTHLYWGNMESR